MLASQVQELDGDTRIVELLGASIEGNVAAIVHMLAHEIPVQRLAPPAAAMEYARRLAQRGVSVNALVRAYRVGHDRLLSWAFDEIDAVAADREVVGAGHPPAGRRHLRLRGPDLRAGGRGLRGGAAALAGPPQHGAGGADPRPARRCGPGHRAPTSTRPRPRSATRCAAGTWAWWCGPRTRSRRRDRTVRARRRRAAGVPGPPAGQLVRPVHGLGLAPGPGADRPGGGGPRRCATCWPRVPIRCGWPAARCAAGSTGSAPRTGRRWPPSPSRWSPASSGRADRAHRGGRGRAAVRRPGRDPGLGRGSARPAGRRRRPARPVARDAARLPHPGQQLHRGGRAAAAAPELGALPGGPGRAGARPADPGRPVRRGAGPAGVPLAGPGRASPAGRRTPARTDPLR